MIDRARRPYLSEETLRRHRSLRQHARAGRPEPSHRELPGLPECWPIRNSCKLAAVRCGRPFLASMDKPGAFARLGCPKSCCREVLDELTAADARRSVFRVHGESWFYAPRERYAGLVATAWQ